MHGRLKEKTTAEQAEAKRLERQKKLKIYNAATARVMEKRKNKEYDKEGLQIAGQILSANPDVYTLWNFRREVFEAFKTQKTEDEMNKLFEEELYFVETCLRANPKSYGSWNQRCYVMTNMPRPDWMNELTLCNKFLEYDERNFHCWDYRRFVVQKAAVSPVEELEFSTNKISSNFSNYSSWHYRSKLLPLVKPDPSQHIGITEEALLSEFEIVQNAFFTDPDDQSAWFYHRWLLGRGQRKTEVESLILNREGGVLTVGLTASILVGKDFVMEVSLNGDQLKGKWSTPFNVHRHSSVWVLSPGNLTQVKEAVMEVRLVVCSSGECASQARVSLSTTEDRAAKLNTTQTPTLFRREISAAATEFLTQELEQCQELHDLEPENKWALLTIVLLMRSLSPAKYRDKISSSLNKLQSLDPKRKEYYRDLRSRFLFEMALESSIQGGDGLDLSEKGISSVYHHNLLLTVRHLDLSRNSIWSLKNFSCLQGLESLDLHGNQLTHLHGLGYLPSLTSINIQDNNIDSVEAFSSLMTCPKLKRLDVSGNPCVAKEGFVAKLQTFLPNVDIHT